MALQISWTACAAEFLAMLLFVVIGCGSAMGVAGRPDSAWVLEVSLVFGFAITSLAYSVGHFSGGHINCAVTLGLVLAKQCDPQQGLANFGAQMAGSLAGAALLCLMVPPESDRTGGLGSNGVSEAYGWYNALAGEALMTFLLVFVVLMTACHPNSAANRSQACIAIGFAVFLAHSVLIPIDGCSINPTRSFGPAVMAQLRYAGSTSMRDMWIFWAGPLLGAAAAAGAWEAFQKASAYDELQSSRAKEYEVDENDSGDSHQVTVQDEAPPRRHQSASRLGLVRSLSSLGQNAKYEAREHEEKASESHGEERQASAPRRHESSSRLGLVRALSSLGENAKYEARDTKEETTQTSAAPSPHRHESASRLGLVRSLSTLGQNAKYEARESKEEEGTQASAPRRHESSSRLGLVRALSSLGENAKYEAREHKEEEEEGVRVSPSRHHESSSRLGLVRSLSSLGENSKYEARDSHEEAQASAPRRHESSSRLGLVRALSSLGENAKYEARETREEQQASPPRRHESSSRLGLVRALSSLGENAKYEAREPQEEHQQASPPRRHESASRLGLVRSLSTLGQHQER